MSACVEATALGPQRPHTFTTPAPVAETGGRVALTGPTWLQDGDTQRAIIGGYAAWVKPHQMASFGWRYGVTTHGVDGVMGFSDTEDEAKQSVTETIATNLRPVGEDGLQAVRLSGVAKILLGEDHPTAPRWNPLPRLIAAEKAITKAKTATTMLDALASLDELNKVRDYSRADWPNGDKDMNRWVRAEARVLRKLAGTEPATVDEAEEVHLRLSQRISGDVLSQADVNMSIWVAIVRCHKMILKQARDGAPREQSIQAALPADGALLAACAAATSAHHAWMAINTDEEEWSDEKVREYQEPAVDTVCAVTALPAYSLPALAAKAQVALLAIENARGREKLEWDGECSASVLDDVIRLAQGGIVQTAALEGSVAALVAELGEHWKEISRLDKASLAAFQAGHQEEHGALDQQKAAVYRQLWATEAEACAATPTTLAEATQQLRIIGSQLSVVAASERTDKTQDEEEVLLGQLHRVCQVMARLSGADLNSLTDSAYEFGPATRMPQVLGAAA